MLYIEYWYFDCGIAKYGFMDIQLMTKKVIIDYSIKSFEEGVY